MTIAESINKLADKMAGEPTKGGETIEQAVDNLTEYAGGGGGSIVYVEVDGTPTAQGAYIAEKSYSEIKSLVDGGAVVYLKQGDSKYQVVVAYGTNGTYQIIAVHIFAAWEGSWKARMAMLSNSQDYNWQADGNAFYANSMDI